MHLDLERKESNLLYVKKDLPCFIAVAGKNCNTINYSMTKEKIRRYEKHLIHFETGIAPETIYILDQEHEDHIIEASDPYPSDQYAYATADALITDKPGNCLVIRTADCVPLFIIDKKNNAVAAIHSGWRSTVKNITGKTLAAMNERYGSEIADLEAYFLPSIGAEYYEVKEDVAIHFPNQIKESDGKKFLDLRAAVYEQLKDAGLGKRQIFAAWQDTFSFNDMFYSHRKKDEGRNLNFAYLY